MKDLQKVREEFAEKIFNEFDFHGAVEASSGWEYTTPGRDMSRMVYLENEEGGDTERAVFHVVFKSCDSSEVSEAYALLMSNGCYVGESYTA